jgi:cholesterol oxidase
MGATGPPMPDLVRFTETMRGHLAPGEPDFLAAERRGRSAGGEALFVLTVVTPDVDRMVDDPDHRSPAYGCLIAPALHAKPIRVEAGHLDLFADAAPDGRVLHMRYGLRLRDADGRPLFLAGFKEVCRRRWYPTFLADTTTLFTAVHEGEDATGPILRQGVLRMGPVGFFGQVATFRGEGGWWGARGILRYLAYYVRRVTRITLGRRTPSPREDRLAR